MTWRPAALTTLMNKTYDGFAMMQLFNSLVRELERMQQEIDELKRRVGDV